MKKISVGATLVACIFLTVCVVYSQINFGSWTQLFFYNGDSITLALLIESIKNKESFNWIFSSQTFLFPEVPIYFLSYLLTQNHRVALVANAILNIFILYFFVYLLAKQLYSTILERIVPIILISLFLCLSLILESNPLINSASIVTLLLFNTYYYGSILVALFLLFLMSEIKNKNLNVYSIEFISAVVIGALTYGSNPLLLIYFLVPMLAISLFYTIGEEGKSVFIKIILAIAICLIIGTLIRRLTSHYIALSVNGYIDLLRMPESFMKLINVLSTSIKTKEIFLLWFMWLILYVFHAAAVFRLIVKNKSEFVSQTFPFVHLFFILTPVFIIAAVVVSGNYLTRYLIPIPLFTLVGFSLLIPRLVSFRSQCFLIFCLLAFSIFGIINRLSNPSIVPDVVKSDIDCYVEVAQKKKLISVGSFWTSRYLTLHGGRNVYQVTNDFNPHNWLSNRYDFSNIIVNSVVVDKAIHPAHLNEKNAAVLGAATNTYECHSFLILYFDEFSDGFNILNKKLSK